MTFDYLIYHYVNPKRIQNIMSKQSKTPDNLLQMIYQKRWSNIYQYLNEAEIPDKTNTYPLHEICTIPSAPIKAVKDIYYANPDAAKAKNNCNDTPISLAVDVEFEDAVNFLAKACPAACEHCDALGDTPIKTAIFIINNKNMIDSIITHSPESAFILDSEGNSAFAIFFRHWNVYVRIAVHINGIVLNHSTGHGDWKTGDIYRHVCLFLKAAYFYRTGEELDDNCLLHCALREESCHWAFCKMLMELHPKQVFQRDSDGNLPIHIITASKESTDETTFLCFDCFSNKSVLVNIEYMNGTSKYCCEDCFKWEQESSIHISYKMGPVKKVHNMIKELLVIAPGMALTPNRNGNYPMHISIQHQHNYDIIYQLFKAIPETGQIKDEETKLLPFMLAALGDWHSEIDQINVIYQLLREDPHSVSIANNK